MLRCLVADVNSLQAFPFRQIILDASSFCQARKRKAKSLDSPHSFLNLPDSSNTTLLCCISCETCAILSPQATKSVFEPTETADALCIKKDLEARGHRVWFDLERLKPGQDWELYIEEGLSQCEKVVLLMTPHSVRRRNPADAVSQDGFCLNEIAKALERNRVIIPVLLADLPCGPPLSICRIQYLDMRDAIPVIGNRSRYET